MNSPWECPRCKRINAPYLPYCECKPSMEVVSITEGGSIPLSTHCSKCMVIHEIGKCINFTWQMDH